MDEPEMMDESKETVSSTYNQDWCTYELRVYGSMHRASTGSNHTKSQHWKSKSAKVPHLTKMLYLQLIPAGEGKISFLRQSDNEYINYSSGQAQYKTNADLLWMCVWGEERFISFLWHVPFVLMVFCLFQLLFESKRVSRWHCEQALSWAGNNELGRVWGRKKMIEITEKNYKFG